MEVFGWWLPTIHLAVNELQQLQTHLCELRVQLHLLPEHQGQSCLKDG